METLYISYQNGATFLRRNSDNYMIIITYFQSLAR